MQWLTDEFSFVRKQLTLLRFIQFFSPGPEDVFLKLLFDLNHVCFLFGDRIK
ncbi:MAG: hypothetical protein ACI97P_001267 [Arcticibacterium sp.]|jgi:hypothetical protein